MRHGRHPAAGWPSLLPARANRRSAGSGTPSPVPQAPQTPLQPSPWTHSKGWGRGREAQAGGFRPRSGVQASQGNCRCEPWIRRRSNHRLSFLGSVPDPDSPVGRWSCSRGARARTSVARDPTHGSRTTAPFGSHSHHRPQRAKPGGHSPLNLSGGFLVQTPNRRNADAAASRNAAEPSFRGPRPPANRERQ